MEDEEKSDDSSEDEVFFGCAISSKEKEKALRLVRRRRTMGEAELKKSIEDATSHLEGMQLDEDGEDQEEAVSNRDEGSKIEDDSISTPPNSPFLVTCVRENSERRLRSAVRRNTAWSAAKCQVMREENAGQEEEEEEGLRPVQLNFSNSDEKRGTACEEEEDEIIDSESDGWETDSEEEEEEEEKTDSFKEETDVDKCETDAQNGKHNTEINIGCEVIHCFEDDCENGCKDISMIADSEEEEDDSYKEEVDVDNPEAGVKNGKHNTESNRGTELTTCFEECYENIMNKFALHDALEEEEKECKSNNDFFNIYLEAAGNDEAQNDAEENGHKSNAIDKVECVVEDEGVEEEEYRKDVEYITAAAEDDDRGIEDKGDEEEQYRKDIEYIAATDDTLGSDHHESISENSNEEDGACISDTIGEFIRKEEEDEVVGDLGSCSQEIFFPQQNPSSADTTDDFGRSSTETEPFKSAVDVEKTEKTDELIRKEKEESGDGSGCSQKIFFHQTLVSTDSYFTADDEDETETETFLSAVDLERTNEERPTGSEPNFDTTVDEMLLYDMFGENYDEKVEAMGFLEKVTLQKLLAVRKEGQSEEEVKSQLCQSLQLPKSPQPSPLTKMPLPLLRANPMPLPRTIPSLAKSTLIMRPPPLPSRSKLPQPGHVLRKPFLVPAASPVAAYLRNNPCPSLVHNVAAKQVSRLESTLLEVEEAETGSEAACFLPTNTYESAPTQEEMRGNERDAREYPYIPRAYGQEQIAEVCVTKHLGRRGRDELEVSILQTRVVRKFATPLQKKGRD